MRGLSPGPPALLKTLWGPWGPLPHPHLHSLPLNPPHLLGPAQGRKGEKSRGEPGIQDIGVWETEWGMGTIGTSASEPQPTATHLSSPSPIHRDQGSSPLPHSQLFRPYLLYLTTCSLKHPDALPCPPQLRYPPLSRVSSAPGLPVNSAATSLASASVRPTTQQSFVSPCRSKG